MSAVCYLDIPYLLEYNTHLHFKREVSGKKNVNKKTVYIQITRGATLNWNGGRNWPPGQTLDMPAIGIDCLNTS